MTETKSVFKIKSHDCDIIEIEPGDNSKYIFSIISRDDKFITISGVDGTHFHGYTFYRSSIEDMFHDIGEPPNQDEYYKWADQICHRQPSFFKYVMEKAGSRYCPCNPFTALAGLYAAHIFITSENLP